jgi:2-polyprenyl-6-methoxyphenol hydroxylase-like FAD-dependent oxidoreductase
MQAKRTAEIAGAGLAGLSIATRLAQLGWKVRVHERNPELRMFGAGIWLWENGLRALELIGAFEQATANARRISEWRICEPDGEVLFSRPTTPTDRLLLPPRADLYAALIGQAQYYGVAIETSSRVTSADPSGRLTLEGGRELQADLVIAADGAYSLLREALQCSRWMDYGTEIGIRMLIDHVPGWPTDVISEYWNGSSRLLYNPCTNGQDYVFLGGTLNNPRASRYPVDRQYWAEAFPAFESTVRNFKEDGRWDRIVAVRCRRWANGRAVVIGDAAHAMPPNLGQAGNMAFTNSMSLALAVDKSRDIPAALAAWEKRERYLTNHVQNWSYLYGYAVAYWPERFIRQRSRLIKAMAARQRVVDSLNRGARHVPDGAEFARVSEAV